MRLLSFIALVPVASFLAAQEPAPAPVPTPAPMPSAVPMPPMPGAKNGPPGMPNMPGMPQMPSPASSQMPPPLPTTATTTQPAPPPNPTGLPPVKTSDDAKSSKPAAASAIADGPVIPQAFPRDRYEASWKKNPFLLKTAPVVQAKESWATDYALTSVAKMNGRYRVSIKNKKTGESKRLMQGDEEGEFKIVSVNLKADRKSTSVEVEKGGEKAALTYDPTMSAAQPRGAVPGMPGGARPGMPTIPGMPQGTVPTPTIRTTSTGATSGGTVVGNSAINRNQGVAAAPSYGGSAGGPSYSGNAYGGGGFVGGVVGNTGGAAAAQTTAAGAPTSRLGALGPQAGATGNSGLVPMVGGTRVTTTTTGGTTTIDATATNDPGNIVPATTSATSTNSVTRRRTLIPAPVISQ